jgi:hypothetical protein
MDDFNQEPQGWFARNAPQPGNTGPTPNSGAVPASQPDPNYSWFAANAPPSARKPAAVTSWKQDLENDLWGSGGAVPGGDGWGVRPETANFLRNLAGIGTGPYLDMRRTEAPVYQQWRDRNFTPVGSGKFVSPGGGGQAYTQPELRQMHDLLSRQAGNPMVSRLFNGPKSPVADFMVWRNQNFAANRGTFQDEDGTYYSHPELESMFAAKSQARPAQVQNPAAGDANQGSANRQPPQLLAQNAAAPQTQPSPGAAAAAGNPPLRVADPVQALADFMRWRNQNFRPTQDGRWEGTDARVRTNEELRGLYAAQRADQAQRQSRPQAQAHLTADERDEAAAVAYSENTSGSVAEHEAIISVLLNRARSGDRQYVNQGQDVNLFNAAHATTRTRTGRDIQEFQGVDDNNYNDFVTGLVPRQGAQGARNAQTAAANIAQNGPTTQATSIIVTGGRNPTRREEANLGHNMRQVGRVGNVFLYAPAPPPLNPPGPRNNPQPQRQQPQPQPNQ